jgi:DNA (cytosine-5)-methyltransferase 1
MTQRTPTFIDLFCGCGGFSLGLKRAGFRCLAALDFNSEAISTFRANMPDMGFVAEKDLTKFRPAHLAREIGDVKVDLIVGGPPCQGFSTARQVDGANHGSRLKDDPRRFLYREFLRYVDFYQPKVFVMENVPGLRSAAGGEFFDRIHSEARELGRSRGMPGYRVSSQTEDAFELGVPQKRKRVLIIGVRGDLPGTFPDTLSPAGSARPGTVLWDAIGDLPPLAAGDCIHNRSYDSVRRIRFLESRGPIARHYLSRVLEVNRAKFLANHVARPHSERDLRDFARLREGENSAVAMRDRGVKFEFPYKKHHFKDRYTKQHRERACSTIVAHLSKDGLMFIHPTQQRSLTPREAARIQSFPDWFVFPEAKTHAFRLIGNAVPPLIGEAVGQAVMRLPAFKRNNRGISNCALEVMK